MRSILAQSLSTVLALVGTSFLLPMFVAGWYGEWRNLADFGVPLVISWAMAVWFSFRSRGKIRLVGVQNAFVVVGSVWVAIGLFGAWPLYASGCFPGLMDAVFESVSGFTTTGASVLSDVESLPKCINFWRCQTHWLGGMGVIALAVALIPFLGVGAFRLIQAEASGPEKGKLTSRIGDTARVLWLIYFVLTVAQAAALHSVGMGWFDAVCHAFSTMGTGGFSTRNASFGAFGNPAAEWICTLFMLLASVNFGVYYAACTGKWAEVRDNTELRGFVFLLVPVVAVVTLLELPQFGAVAGSLRAAAFQVASVVSTTGFMTSDYTTWTPAAQMLVLLLFFVGGCSGSTAGGIKIIRWSVLAKALRNDLLGLLHPHGVFTLRINGIPAKREIVSLVGSFIFVYFLVVFVTALAGAAFGLDVNTAVTASLSMVGNIGPAFGSLGPAQNYGALPDALKAIYCVAMLAGRLEVYTLMILVGKSFSRP